MARQYSDTQPHGPVYLHLGGDNVGTMPAAALGDDAARQLLHELRRVKRCIR